MRILYVHPNFPAQFGHIAAHLAAAGHTCWFVSETPAARIGTLEKIPYQIQGGATEQTHYCTRTFENAVWHCDAVYAALKARPDIQPDLIVGHSGFGSTLFLRELYPKVPILNLFEYYYTPFAPDNDLDFRHDLGWEVSPQKRHRAQCRNAMILLDLQNCTAGYTPTQFQKSRFPGEYHRKLSVIFDGIDRSIFHSHGDTLRPPVNQRGDRTIAGIPISAGTRIVTYVSRGFESIRGFDLFIRTAGRIMEQFPDVHFFVVGADRVAYGGDLDHIAPYKTFSQWTLAHHPIDVDRLTFLGRLTPADLSKLLATTDLHCYWTAPFVLSWSLMDALSCGAVVLASDTAPLREVITDGQNGLLTDFFDVDQWAHRAMEVLRDPDAFRPLGRAAEHLIESKYSLKKVLPQVLSLYQSLQP